MPFHWTRAARVEKRTPSAFCSFITGAGGFARCWNSPWSGIQYSHQARTNSFHHQVVVKGGSRALLTHKMRVRERFSWVWYVLWRWKACQLGMLLVLSNNWICSISTWSEILMSENSLLKSAPSARSLFVPLGILSLVLHHSFHYDKILPMAEARLARE